MAKAISVTLDSSITISNDSTETQVFYTVPSSKRFIGQFTLNSVSLVTNNGEGSVKFFVGDYMLIDGAPATAQSNLIVLKAGDSIRVTATAPNYPTTTGQFTVFITGIEEDDV